MTRYTSYYACIKFILLPDILQGGKCYWDSGDWSLVLADMARAKQARPTANRDTQQPKALESLPRAYRERPAASTRPPVARSRSRLARTHTA